MAFRSPHAGPAVTVVLTAWLALHTNAHAQNVQVVDVQPVPHAVDVSTSTDVRLTVNLGLNPNLVNPATVRVYGRWSGPMTGTFALSSGNTIVDFRPDRPFQPGEQVTVLISDRLRTPTGEALVGGYEFSFWTCPAPGSAIFELAEEIELKLPGEGFLQSYGIYAGDLDRNGSPDFCIPTEFASDVRVLLSEGCGEFSDPVPVPLAFQTGPSANEGQDFDRDGNIDFATAGVLADTLVVLFGDGNGGFDSSATYPVGSIPRGVAVLDGEGDGDPDIVLAHRGSSDLGFLDNNGGGVFAPIQYFDGGVDGETGVAPADANNDGKADLLVAGFLSSEVSILHNVGPDTWDVADVVGIGAQPWMIVAGDLDGDAFPDAATCDSNSYSTSIVLNDGAGGLLPASSLTIGNFSVAVDLGDLDGDGDLDIVASSFADQMWTCWFNDGTGQFPTFQDLPASVAASCATLVDYDRDGRMDIVGLDEMADTVRLWRQAGAAPVGVQPATCSATLRLNNQASQAGFGGQGPLEASVGEILHFGITTSDGALFGLFVGSPLEPGPTLPQAGTLNLGSPFMQFIGVTDAEGDYAATIEFPPQAVGLEVAMQAYVVAAGIPVLTNPEVLRLVP